MSSTAKILVVEDETDVCDLMLLHLRREGFEPSSAASGETAYELLKVHEYDCVILDWMLPGMSGLELCRMLEQKKRGAIATAKPHILMVTAKAATAEIVQGLEAGADDYVTKPFEIPVFLARVRALVRRSQPPETSVFHFGNLVIDDRSHSVRCQGNEIQLTFSEFKLLVALAKNAGKVLSRKQLIDQVQGVKVIDRAIDTHVFGLRNKLGECADFVETVRGVGYRIRQAD